GAAANAGETSRPECSEKRETSQTADRLGAIHGRETLRVDRRARAVPGRGVFREVFVRAQSDSAGASGCDRVRRRCRPYGWGFASKTARKCCHCTDALRNRHSGAVCGDVCLPSLLSLRVVWFRPNVFVDDADHGGCFCACRPIERDRRGGAWDCGWLSHARPAFKGRREFARTVGLHRSAGYRPTGCRATTTLERAADPGRDRYGGGA